MKLRLPNFLTTPPVLVLAMGLAAVAAVERPKDTPLAVVDAHSYVLTAGWVAMKYTSCDTNETCPIAIQGWWTTSVLDPHRKKVPLDCTKYPCAPTGSCDDIPLFCNYIYVDPLNCTQDP